MGKEVLRMRKLIRASLSTVAKFLWVLIPCFISSNSSPSGFVSTDGAKFMINSRPHYFLSANFWQGANLGMNQSRLDAELDMLKSFDITNLRVMAASEGPDTEPYRYHPSIQPKPGQYNEDVLKGLDYLLVAMASRGMRAVMQLNNFWHWSGGMAQYVSWATNTPIPYPNDTGDWDRFQRYAEQFYSCDQCLEWWHNHITTIVTRINTITHISYIDDPVIFSWEFANEPRNFPLGWVSNTAKLIKSLDSNHMVTLGMEGFLPPDSHVTDEWVAAHSYAQIDYATYHIWVQNRGWYDPKNVSGTYDFAVSKARDKFFRHQTDAVKVLNKPVVFEEFGLARDLEEYTPGTSVHMRDDFYTKMMQLAYDTAKTQVGGIGGIGIWAWSGHAYPPDMWIGDPPHEPPGWYSVYDTDHSTGAILHHFGKLFKQLS